EDLAGVEDALRVERVLHRAHRGDGDGVAALGEVPALHAPDAVLAGDRAAQARRDVEDRLDGGTERGLAADRVGVVEQDVDVDVPVAGVAVGDLADAEARGDLADAAEEVGDLRGRDGGVALDVGGDLLDGLPQGAAQAPEVALLRGRVGEDDIEGARVED